MTMLGIALLVIAVIFIYVLPRKYATLPIIFAACYLTLGQFIMISVFHFSGLRILIFFIILRLILKRELNGITFNKIDFTFFSWVLFSAVIYIILHGTTDALVNRLGFAYNAIGLYVAFRFTIRDISEIETLIRAMAIIAIPLSLLMLIEYTTGRNIFSIFGGVPEYTAFRGDRLRCQGPFAHPILAGTFGATLMPFIFSLWFKERSRFIAFLGFAATSIIVFVSSSSGPLIAFLAAILALSVYPLRDHMRLIRWAVFGGIIGLHIFMNAPVWALIGRLGNLIGGTGWHRVELINAAVSHISDWWLMGTRTTAHWGLDTLAGNPNMIDITNQFVSEAVMGGTAKLFLFILMLVLCFSIIGKSLKACKDKHTKILIWSLGATLFAHIASFLSVAYFDQITTFWFMLLAIVGTLGNIINEPEKNDDNSASAGHIAR